MAFALDSVASSFWFNEAEPYDGGPEPSETPTSVWHAIESMRILDPDRWAELAREVFNLDNPEFLTAEAVLDKVRETCTCRDLRNPVECYIDEDGYFSLEVHDLP